MKKLALVFGALMLLGAVSGVEAQAQNPSGSASVDVKTDSKAPSANVDVNTNRTDRPGFDVNINKRDSTGRSGDGAALPRAATGDRTTIFGLSPTAAVIVAAALLVVVILAIVAMTRSGSETTIIDRDRRPPLV